MRPVFFKRVPSWYKMAAGLYAARVPGVVAAAAGLATAATSVGFTDKLHPTVAPILFHSALFPPTVSSTSSSLPLAFSGFVQGSRRLTAACDSPSGALGQPRQEPAAVVVSSLNPSISAHMASPSLGRSFGIVSSASARQFCLSHASQSATAPSPLRAPSFLYPTLEFPQDVLHRRFLTVRSLQSHELPTTAFGEFSHLPRFKAPLNSPHSLDGEFFDLSAQLGARFSSAPLSHPPATSPKSLHRWHTPGPRGSGPADEGSGAQPGKESALTVVLLGWLGSQQKHLKKYAEWYNARGIHAVTFTLPMRDVLSVSMGGKVEEHVEELTNQLSTWVATSEEMDEEKSVDRQLIFHIFSNTGWLTYGVVLEKLSSRGNDWADKIKGCVVDSAPAADPDPSVWASGFSAALWKKRNGASGNGGERRDSGIADSRHKVVVQTPNSRVAESALQALLEKFFFVFLQIPFVHQRLSQVIAVLSKEQPLCPQLYIYSTADKVIPSELVESFMETQRQQGRVVRSCNFLSSPHVDHFRSFPEIYGNQVSSFLHECLQKSSVELTTRGGVPRSGYS